MVKGAKTSCSTGEDNANNVVYGPWTPSKSNKQNSAILAVSAKSHKQVSNDIIKGAENIINNAGSGSLSPMKSFMVERTK